MMSWLRRSKRSMIFTVSVFFLLLVLLVFGRSMMGRQQMLQESDIIGSAAHALMYAQDDIAQNHFRAAGGSHILCRRNGGESTGGQSNVSLTGNIEMSNGAYPDALVMAYRDFYAAQVSPKSHVDLTWISPQLSFVVQPFGSILDFRAENFTVTSGNLLESVVVDLGMSGTVAAVSGSSSGTPCVDITVRAAGNNSDSATICQAASGSSGTISVTDDRGSVTVEFGEFWGAEGRLAVYGSDFNLTSLELMYPSTDQTIRVQTYDQVRLSAGETERDAPLLLCES
ncbi:MAG: hypothetical protein ACOCWQ_01355 [Nanoarchaeota archaeon]